MLSLLKKSNKCWERIKSLIEEDTTEESSSDNSQLNDPDFFIEDLSFIKAIFWTLS